ncbi:unnamed protein product [Somion occarium]|uniref:Uncharacterized protein n=1 Tax=Somion occarium TaxID=3059160 RepID=A0ABP1CX63_9APHY
MFGRSVIVGNSAYHRQLAPAIRLDHDPPSRMRISISMEQHCRLSCHFTCFTYVFQLFFRCSVSKLLYMVARFWTASFISWVTQWLLPPLQLRVGCSFRRLPTLRISVLVAIFLITILHALSNQYRFFSIDAITWLEFWFQSECRVEHNPFHAVASPGLPATRSNSSKAKASISGTIRQNVYFEHQEP